MRMGGAKIIVILLYLYLVSLCSCTSENKEETIVPIISLKTDPLIGSHRGHYLYPENTYEGIKAAVDAGFMIVEFDIQMTKDSILVLHHDLTIDRCSNGTGTISELNYEDLMVYDYGLWKDSQFSGIKMPTLDNILKLVKNSNILVEIDLLSHSYDTSSIVLDKTYELVDFYGLVNKCLFNVTISNAKRICELSNNKGNLSIMYPGYDKLPDIANLLSNDHFTYISINKNRLNSDIINECRRWGIRTEVFGAKTQKELDSLLQIGCNYVMVEEFVPIKFER